MADMIFSLSLAAATLKWGSLRITKGHVIFGLGLRVVVVLVVYLDPGVSDKLAGPVFSYPHAKAGGNAREPEETIEDQRSGKAHSVVVIFGVPL